MTFIPVSNVSPGGCLVFETRGSGESGNKASGVSRPSTASPMTLKMRPNVGGPTGTMIGAPVDSTDNPRDKPSVADIATVRTMPPPKCCCTSQYKTIAAGAGQFQRFINLRQSAQGNSTSITTPRMALMIPVAIKILRSVQCSVFSQTEFCQNPVSTFDCLSSGKCFLHRRQCPKFRS